MPESNSAQEPRETPEQMATAVRAVVRLSKAVEVVLAKDQLSVSQFRILERLADGSAHGRSLAEWLAVKPPSVTTLVDGLVKRGLVRRREDGADRRQITHTLTPAGVALHDAVSERLAERLRDILAHAGDAHAGHDATAAMVASLATWDGAIDAWRDARDARDARDRDTAMPA